MTAVADSTRSTVRPLAATAALTALVAAASAVALAAALAAALDVDDAFLPLQAGPVAASAVVGVVLGVVLLLVLRRLHRPALFVPLIALGTLLSCAGPLSLLSATPAEQPGVTDAAALATLPLHLLVGAVVAVGLGRRR